MATIYKIYCRDNEIKDCYVGSTEDYNTRYNKHHTNCYNTKHKEYNLKIYTFIRANGGMDNFIIEPIYECNVEDRYIEEQHWFELLHATLNTNIPNRSRKQHYIDNKEQVLEQRKLHYENNKEQVLEKAKQYRENNKEKAKQYRENNKEKAKIKIECECGSLVRKTDINRHFKTTKHQNYINSKL
jgi:hypothetical protein